MLYSAAMVLEIDPRILAKILGHDGTEKVNGYHVGIHFQEIQQYALSIGKHFYTVEAAPYQAGPDVPAPVTDFYQKIYGRGIMVNDSHAVAYEYDSVYDPQGRIYPVNEFQVMEAYVLCTNH